mmetsp:Transcript_11852/g.17671  ORF Transcript_11852/g.17671 Transcript_11852/m.17671 type:complete len:131 (+) Transcript_11852:179-571(+)
MGSCCSQQDDCGPQEGIGGISTTDSEPLAPVELPPGWKAVPSRSRPGKVAYQNIHTAERISWIPTEEAKTYKGGISKKKKKKSTPSSAAATAQKKGDETDFSDSANVKGETKGTNGTTSTKLESDAIAQT